MSPQVTPQVAPQVASQVAPQVASQVTPQVSPQVAPSVVPQVIPGYNVYGGFIDVPDYSNYDKFLGHICKGGNGASEKVLNIDQCKQWCDSKPECTAFDLISPQINNVGTCDIHYGAHTVASHDPDTCGTNADRKCVCFLKK